MRSGNVRYQPKTYSDPLGIALFVVGAVAFVYIWHKYAKTNGVVSAVSYDGFTVYTGNYQPWMFQ